MKVSEFIEVIEKTAMENYSQLEKWFLNIEMDNIYYTIYVFTVFIIICNMLSVIIGKCNPK